MQLGTIGLGRMAASVRSLPEQLTRQLSPGQRHWLRKIGPAVLGVAAIGILVIVFNPAAVGHALGRFRPAAIPAIIVLYLVIYGSQGVRWHYLLRDAGARLRIGESVLLNAAGQTITALVPLGDLTRAAFASEASGREFGTTAATVTVQELTFNLMLILCALPVLLTLHLGIVVVIATLLGMAGIVIILTVCKVFRAVHRVVARIPLLKRLLPAIDELQVETANLLHRVDTLALSTLDLVRALASVTVFWVVVQALSPGTITWTQAGFALAISSIGGAISLIPGGVGANEASVAGLLVVFGADGGTAAAAALVQRLLITGMAIGLGLGAYAIVRRRFKLGALFELVSHRPASEASG